MHKLNIGSIPELKTSVGIHGSSKQKEVAGPMCLGAILALVIWNQGKH